MVRYLVGFRIPSSGCGRGVLVPCAVETWFTFFCVQDRMDEKWQDDVELSFTCSDLLYVYDY